MNRMLRLSDFPLLIHTVEARGLININVLDVRFFTETVWANSGRVASNILRPFFPNPSHLITPNQPAICRYISHETEKRS
jgi:hypothetical protein